MEFFLIFSKGMNLSVPMICIDIGLITDMPWQKELRPFAAEYFNWIFSKEMATALYKRKKCWAPRTSELWDKTLDIIGLLDKKNNDVSLVLIEPN